MAGRKRIKAPVLILASRESHGSFLASLLGGHPDLYGAPHINLLPFERGWQYLAYCSMPRDTNAHGLLRFLAHQLFGEQSFNALQAARRWLGVRKDRTTVEIYAEMASLVWPQRVVDYSPLNALNIDAMRRAARAFPDAPIIHLVANPSNQARALASAVWQTVTCSQEYWADRGRNHPCMDSYEIGEHLVDWSKHPPVFDPQFSWYRTQKAATQLFEELPPKRCLRITAEELSRDPAAALDKILPHIGVRKTRKAIAEMIGSEDTLFTVPGPYMFASGVDWTMSGRSVRDMAGQALPETEIDPQAPLEWRGDDERFQPKVIDLARDLGYPVKQ